MRHFMLVSSAQGFADVAREELAFLTSAYGFRVAEAGDEVVRFESPSAVVTVTAYAGDRGQVDVTVEAATAHEIHEKLVISRMVGRASLGLVLQLAAEDLRANEPALLGEASFFHALGEEQRRQSEAWTAFYAGEGPRPTGKLP